MHHLPEIIRDLGLILVAAAIVTIIFRKLRQPVVLGYLMAGFLVSPHVPFAPTVHDIADVNVWAEIGVIFLLFALGLEFSFKKLVRVGGPVAVTGTFQTISVAALGYLTGQLFGWSVIDSLFLGGMLSISSTTIIIKVFDEFGLKGRGFAQLVFGVLILEDLAAILMLVLLSTLAISTQFIGWELMTSFVKLGFFLTIWFLMGIFILPTLLQRFKPHINDETLIVVSVGLCFIMVLAATQAGFSPALGAFIMGSILAETIEGERIEHLIKPIKDLFAAVFFISVGMVIEPRLLMENAGEILVVTTVVIVGKVGSVSLGALMAGQSLKRAIWAGLSMAQIGEFSFLIAGLGTSLKVTSPALYPIAVGVSAITAFVTPYMVRSAPWIIEFTEKNIPRSWMQTLARYQSSTHGLTRANEWKELIQSYLTRILVHSALIAALFIITAKFLPTALEEYFSDPKLIQLVSLLAAVLISAPFIWGLLFSHPKLDLVRQLWQEIRYRPPIVVLEASRLGAAIALFTFLAPQFISVRAVIFIALLVLGILLLLFSRYLQAAYNWFESRFQENFTNNSKTEEPATPVINHAPLVPWEAHLSQLEVPPESIVAGRTLEQLGVREKTGVTVALIERGRLRITAPGRYEQFFPFDKVSVLGTDEQIEKFRSFISAPPAPNGEDQVEYGLEQFYISDFSEFCRRTIRESGLRERTKGLVVGIERRGERFLNPGSETVFEPGDLVWIVGDRQQIITLKNS